MPDLLAMIGGATQMTFLHKLAENCTTYGDKVALEFLCQDDPPLQVTYRELGQNIENAMRYLQQLGVESRVRVALQLPKSLSFIYLHIAIMRLGAISLPLNPGYPL